MSDSLAWPRFARQLWWVPLLIAALALSWPAISVPHSEGDEIVHKVLTSQLRHLRYTLRGTIVQQHPDLFAPSLYDRPIHYNPPLYNLTLLACRAAIPRFPYVLLSILSTAATAMLVFALARRRGGPRAGAVAAAVFLLCPITLLVAGKVWSEAFLGLLLFACIDLLDRRLAGSADDLRPTGWLAALGALLVAAALVKTTAVLALPGLLWAALRLPDRLERRRALVVVTLAPLLATAAWFGFMAWVSGDALPRALGEAGDRLRNPFVLAMSRKDPLSFFVVPLLLDPAYLLIASTMLDRQRRRSVAHVSLYALGILLGFTLLAIQGMGTFHNKYISIAMPALAVLAGLAFAPDPPGVRPLLSLRGRALLLGTFLCVLLGQWLIMVFRLPQLPEVDPRMFLSWPAWLF